MLYEHHLPMVRCEYEQPYVKSLSTMLLGLSATTLSCKKGIKLSSGESFIYGKKSEEENNEKNKMPQEKIPLYLYEAGVNPKHAETLNDIHIYVKRDREGTVLVGTLSAAHPCIPLELTLGEDCELIHDSIRRDVFFNGFCFTNAESITFEAKELWFAEVHPSEEINISPVDEGKEYHLLEVYSKKNTNENINFHVRCNERTLLGELVAGCNRTRLNSVFDDVVSLSHNSNATSVFFSGYTVPNQPFEFKLKELNEYEELEEHNLKSTPKISLDPEYQSYKKILAKVPRTSKQQPGANSKQPEVNLVTMSPLTAPLIFDNRASFQFFSGNSRGLFWVPKQELEDGKKRVAETPLKTPASEKKAKIATPSSQDLRFWGVVVKPGVTRECDPGELYCHLSQIALEARTTENVEVFVETDDKSIMLGTLSADNDPHFVTHLVLKKKFKLRHSSRTRNICFTGYEFRIMDRYNTSTKGGVESHEEVLLLIPPDSNTDGYKNNEATHGANKLTAPRPVGASSSIPKATVEEPTSPGKPNGDDKGKTDAKNQGDGDDSESSEDVDYPRKVKKRPMGTPLKTSQGKKAKIETRTTSNKTGKQALKTSDYVHAATPRSARRARKAPESKQTSKQSTTHICSSCSRCFSSPTGLRDHSKAKHGAAD